MKYPSYFDLSVEIKENKSRAKIKKPRFELEKVQIMVKIPNDGFVRQIVQGVWPRYPWDEINKKRSFSKSLWIGRFRRLEFEEFLEILNTSYSAIHAIHDVILQTENIEF